MNYYLLFVGFPFTFMSSLASFVNNYTAREFNALIGNEQFLRNEGNLFFDRCFVVEINLNIS